MKIINEILVPALNEVGSGFAEGKVFLPQLLISAEAAKAAFEVIKASMSTSDVKKKEKIILATVKGDIHDIGKNIVKVLLESYGFTVVDLGRDVEPQRVLDEAKKCGIKNPSTSICNRRIAYGALDIGSKFEAKFIVELSKLYSSMSLFRFRRPKDDVLEFIYYDHLCIDMKYILTKIIEQKPTLKEFCEEMIKAFEKNN